MINKYFFYRKEAGLQRILLENIVFLQSADNYVEFIGYNEKHMVRISLDAAMKLLPDDQFIKIHRSIGVNLYYIERVQKDSLVLFGDPKMELPVSRPFYGDLVAMLNVLENPYSPAYIANDLQDDGVRGICNPPREES